MSEGILLINKPKGATSFSLVGKLRRRLGVKKIGHCGTLDPFATGVMVLLVGRNYTKLSNQFLCTEKEYLAELFLGTTTDTYDSEGEVLNTSTYIPTLEEIQEALQRFQGEVEQIPPMYSAKKVKGKPLYKLARQGITIERKAVTVSIQTEFLRYEYPYLYLNVVCSKGTYIRSIAHDLGQLLQCGAHLTNLQRTRSGDFHLSACIDGKELDNADFSLERVLETLK